MTTLREAAQQALEALESADVDPHSSDAVYKAIADLQAALAEPVQEPVAWVSKRTLDRIKDFDGTIYANGGFDDAVPLYTAPPQRKPPATIDEMFDRMGKAPKGVFYGHEPMTIWMEAWRAAEQHHGIT